MRAASCSALRRPQFRFADDRPLSWLDHESSGHAKGVPSFARVCTARVLRAQCGGSGLRDRQCAPTCRRSPTAKSRLARSYLGYSAAATSLARAAVTAAAVGRIRRTARAVRGLLLARCVLPTAAAAGAGREPLRLFAAG